MMDDAAYRSYGRNEPFAYAGGWVAKDQVTLWPPQAGSWHVVIDLGGKEGRVSASVQIIRG